VRSPHSLGPRKSNPEPPDPRPPSSVWTWTNSVGPDAGTKREGRSVAALFGGVRWSLALPDGGFAVESPDAALSLIGDGYKRIGWATFVVSDLERVATTRGVGRLLALGVEDAMHSPDGVTLMHLAKLGLGDATGGVGACGGHERQAGNGNDRECGLELDFQYLTSSGFPRPERRGSCSWCSTIAVDSLSLGRARARVRVRPPLRREVRTQT
jgi:hypothetical protein